MGIEDNHVGFRERWATVKTMFNTLKQLTLSAFASNRNAPGSFVVDVGGTNIDVGGIGKTLWSKGLDFLGVNDGGNGEELSDGDRVCRGRHAAFKRQWFRQYQYP